MNFFFFQSNNLFYVWNKEGWEILHEHYNFSAKIDNNIKNLIYSNYAYRSQYEEFA